MLPVVLEIALESDSREGTAVAGLVVVVLSTQWRTVTRTGDSRGKLGVEITGRDIRIAFSERASSEPENSHAHQASFPADAAS
jgi:hypothetical protein